MVVVARRSALVVLIAIVVGAGALFVHGGYRSYAVRTGSMLPGFKPGDLVVDQASKEYRVGDVITFRSTTGGPDAVITHRIVEVDGSSFKTKGDANATPDPWTVARSDIVGTVVQHVSHGGYALFYLHQPSGLASLLFVLLGLVLAWRLCFPIELTGAPTAAAWRTDWSSPAAG